MLPEQNHFPFTELLFFYIEYLSNISLEFSLVDFYYLTISWISFNVCCGHNVCAMQAQSHKCLLQ